MPDPASLILATAGGAAIAIGGASVAAWVWRQALPAADGPDAGPFGVVRAGIARRKTVLELVLAGVGGIGTSAVVTLGVMYAWGLDLGHRANFESEAGFFAGMIGTLAFHASVLAWARGLGHPLGLAWTKPQISRVGALVIGPVAGLAAAAQSAAWVEAAFRLGFSVPAQEIVTRQLEADSGSGRVLLVYTVLLAPVLEELVFRGFLHDAALRLGGPRLAIFGVGTLFGLFHMSDPAAVPALIIVGVLWGALRHRTGSAWPCVLAHITNNAFALLV